MIEIPNFPQVTPMGKLNFSISAYRVLYILLLLVQYRSLSLFELNLFLFNNPLIRRTYNSETITKYMNTLRQVGCDIPRANSKNRFHYQLRKNPFSLRFEEDELAVAAQLKKLLATHPDEELYERYLDLLEKVIWGVEEPQQDMLFPDRLKTERRTLGLHRRQALLARFKQLCKDAQVLQLKYYHAEDRPPTKMTVEPHRILQEDAQLFLVGTDRETHQTVRLDLSRIESVNQLPNKIQGTPKPTVVTFQLWGRLAKVYRPYPGEEITVTSSRTGTLLVKTKTDDTAGLLDRLMKYGELCEVLSPTAVREEMAERINRLYQHLQTEAVLSSPAFAGASSERIGEATDSKDLLNRSSS